MKLAVSRPAFRSVPQRISAEPQYFQCLRQLHRSRLSHHSSRRNFAQSTLYDTERRSSYSGYIKRKHGYSEPASARLEDPVIEARKLAEFRARTIRKMWYNGAGLALSFMGIVVTVYMFPLEKTAQQPIQNEAPRDSTFSSGRTPVPAGARKPQDDSVVDLVSTNAAAVPLFPRTIKLPTSTSSGSLLATPEPSSGVTASLPARQPAATSPETYHLLGLGIRTVSFLAIKVYVVGIYVAESDIPLLQKRLIEAASDAPGATTLISTEKQALHQKLLDGNQSAEIWDEVLRKSGKDGAVRSVIRVVPTRNTDMSHLRDGWIRGITARTKSPEFEDEGFGRAIGELKAVMGGAKQVATGRALLLGRDREGRTNLWIEEGGKADWKKIEQSMRRGDQLWKYMGAVLDERLGRLILQIYLSGNVSSEEARKSVVDGIMEIVERPIGTLETMVV